MALGDHGGVTHLCVGTRRGNPATLGGTLALVVEQAGGRATDGCRSILDIVPEDLHQKTPLVIGSRDDVAFAARVIGAETAVPAK